MCCSILQICKRISCLPEGGLNWAAPHLNTFLTFCVSLFRSALEHFKRWLIPEKVAISAEELEYLLRPSQSKEAAEPNKTQSEEETEGEKHNPEEDDAHSPEKWVFQSLTLKEELIRRAFGRGDFLPLPLLLILSCWGSIVTILAKAFVNNGQRGNYSLSSSSVSPATEC